MEFTTENTGLDEARLATLNAVVEDVYLDDWMIEEIVNEGPFPDARFCGVFSVEGDDFDRISVADDLDTLLADMGRSVAEGEWSPESVVDLTTGKRAYVQITATASLDGDWE